MGRSRNKKKSVAEQQINKKKHSEINDIIEQYAEIKAVKKNNKKSDFHQIFKYESTAKQQKIMRSDLSLTAAPFVPKNVKHKYNDDGVLKRKQKKVKPKKASPTFSSLYSSKKPASKNDEDLFLLNMAKAITGNGTKNEKIEDKMLQYHVPDGILSSPTNSKKEKH